MNTSSQKRWYAEGLRFECRRCGACCTGEPGYVWVTQDESKKIADFMGLSPSEFSTKYLRKDGRYDSLIELPVGQCVFYSHNACAIYPVRPMQCETFPFWHSVVVSPEAWSRCQAKCPGMGSGKLYSPEEIEEIAERSSTGCGGQGFYPR